jgi:hypothetical protein
MLTELQNWLVSNFFKNANLTIKFNLIFIKIKKWKKRRKLFNERFE